MIDHLLKLIHKLHQKVTERADAVAADSGEQDFPGPTPGPDLIRGILSFRRRRSTMFPATLFGEPAWDILLELYGAQIEGRMGSVSSICIAAAVPATTALRWINALEDDGWIRRRPDVTDRSCFSLELSDQGRSAMDRLFARPPPLPN